MTKQELMVLLRDANQTAHSVDKLNRLIEENPYFHTGHQLYIKGLQKTNAQKMALQLGKTALSVRDRNVLYDYLNHPFQPVSSEQLMDIVRRQLELISSPHEEEKSQPSPEALPATEKVAENLSSHHLIDSFLASNPKIIPDDKNSYQADLTESLQENQEIHTETLADIYAQQGNKDKAIKIYEHLYLKYPEKHIYFAAQIERLKE